MLNRSAPARWLGAAAIVTGLLSLPATARTAEEVLSSASDPAGQGRAIASEQDRRDTGWGDYTNDFRMILRDGGGREIVRTGRQMFKEVPASDEGDKSLIIFDQPRDIAGTVTLTHSKILDPDDQWIYLPEVKRVKRISSANKSGSFVGSEFAFEDLASQEVDKYSYRYLGMEPCGEALPGAQCFKMERYPEYDNSGYSKQVVWSDTEEFEVRRIDYYARNQSLLKTLTFTGYQQFGGRYWRAGRFHMVNHQNGRSTTLELSNYRFANGLSDSEFSQGRMARIR